jgi:hypothetical protein
MNRWLIIHFFYLITTNYSVFLNTISINFKWLFHFAFSVYAISIKQEYWRLLKWNKTLVLSLYRPWMTLWVARKHFAFHFHILKDIFSRFIFPHADLIFFLFFLIDLLVVKTRSFWLTWPSLMNSIVFYFI